MAATPHAVIQQHSEVRWSAPGKIFLLGEYAVMAGSPALVAAMGPRFSLSRTPFEGATETRFHPESPAGKLIGRLEAGRDTRWFWQDPLAGAGGFGASTAQALLVQALVSKRDLQDDDLLKFLKSYREDAASGGVPPSGADLVTQALGGVLEFQPESTSAPARIIQRGDALSQIHVVVIQASLKANRKVATHEHLRTFSGEMLKRIVRDLDPVLERAIPAFAACDARVFGACLVEYADVLSRYDLELAGAREDRHALAQVPGVLGVKGAGALQSDALVAVVDSAQWDREAFVSVLSAHGLVLLSERLTFEPGLQSFSSAGAP